MAIQHTNPSAGQPRTNGGQYSTWGRPKASAALDGNGLHVPAPRTEPMTVTAANGVPFHIRIVRPGDRYGRNGGLVADGTLVEFYDARHPFSDVEPDGPDGAEVKRGQFVSRYYAETLLGTDGYGRGTGGIDLYGGEPSWKVDAETMEQVREWVRIETADADATDVPGDVAAYGMYEGPSVPWPGHIAGGPDAEPPF